MIRAGFRGAWGPGPQASHQKGASHQTLQFLFRAHYRQIEGCGTSDRPKVERRTFTAEYKMILSRTFAI